MFKTLNKYCEREGHCFVPHSYGLLGRWCRDQRMAHKIFSNGGKSHLNQVKVGLLESQGFDFCFESKREKHWNDMYAALVRYKDEHGHFIVPQNHHAERGNEDLHSLGLWVKNQRSFYRKVLHNDDDGNDVDAMLAKIRRNAKPDAARNIERVQLLNKIGFYRSVRSAVGKTTHASGSGIHNAHTIAVTSTADHTTRAAAGEYDDGDAMNDKQVSGDLVSTTTRSRHHQFGPQKCGITPNDAPPEVKNHHHCEPAAANVVAQDVNATDMSPHIFSTSSANDTINASRHNPTHNVARQQVMMIHPSLPLYRQQRRRPSEVVWNENHGENIPAPSPVMQYSQRSSSLAAYEYSVNAAGGRRVVITHSSSPHVLTAPMLIRLDNAPSYSIAPNTRTAANVNLQNVIYIAAPPQQQQEVVNVWPIRYE